MRFLILVSLQYDYPIGGGACTLEYGSESKQSHRDQPVHTSAQSLWGLLASGHRPTVIGLLQAHLYESERSLPTSIFHERIGTDLEKLRAQGEDFPQMTQAYIASWLADGYLERCFPVGASEEEYELSTAAVETIRFVSAWCSRHSAATESRLARVIEDLPGLQKTPTRTNSAVSTISSIS